MKKILIFLTVLIISLVFFIIIKIDKPIYRCYDFNNDGDISVEEVIVLKEVISKCGNNICEDIEKEKRFPCPLDCEY